MNRRSFFKIVTGFITGLFCVPKKADSTVYSLWAEGKSVPAEVFEREGLHTGRAKLRDSDLIKPKVKDVKRSDTRLATEEQTKLLTAIFGPPRCEPCYDDCPHQVQCYGRSQWTDELTRKGILSPSTTLTLHTGTDREIIDEWRPLSTEKHNPCNYRTYFEKLSNYIT